MRIRTSLLVLVSLFWSLNATANGGPVAWTHATPLGDIGPIAESVAIELEAETLDLRLEDDMTHYEVVAQYTLQNPAAEAAPITYGVPLTWVDDYEEERSPRRAAVAETIEIRVAGEPVRCTLVDEPPRDPEEGTVYSPTPQFKSWCVADLDIPPGRSTLELSYRAELWYEDVEVSKSALTLFDQRVLHYPLSPATRWGGGDAVVDVQVHLGPFAALDEELVEIELPEGVDVRRRGETLSWTQKLDASPNLAVTFNAIALMSKDQLRFWNRDAQTWKKVELEASGDEGVDNRASRAPKNLLDGDLKTTWRPAAKSPTLELKRVPRADEDDDPTKVDLQVHGGCRVEALTLVTSEEVCTGPSPSKARLAACGVEEGQDVELLWEDGVAYVLADWDFERTFDLGQSDACVAITLTDAHSVCLSEASLIINCG